MSEILQALLSAFNNAENTDDAQQAMRDQLTGHDEFSELRGELRTEFDALDTADTGAVDRMEQLAAAMETVGTVEREQAELASRRRAAANRFTTSLDSTPSPEPEPDPEPVVVPETNEGGDARDSAAEPQLVTADGGSADPVVEPSAVARQNPVPLDRLQQQNLSDRISNRRRSGFTFFSAADIPGIATGAQIEDMQQLGKAVQLRMGSLARVGGGRSSGAVAKIERTAAPEATYSHEGDWAKIQDVCDERNLPGGSLIAAAGDQGGWCAPSEQLYDMCPTASVDGLVDLPEMVANRGGVKYPVLPDFMEVYTGAGFHFTEEQITGSQDPPIEPHEKPCFRMPCPDMRECRLDVDGICITTDLLTERAWPEAVEYFTAQVLAAHAHRINAWVLARMVWLAKQYGTQVTLPYDPSAGADPNQYVYDPHGPGATAKTLSMIELQVEQIRSKYRLPMNATLEMVAPHWLRGLLRSDLSKRVGVDNWLSVTNAQLEAHFAVRGVRVQWVRDWQDAFGLVNQGTVNNPDWKVDQHCNYDPALPEGQCLGSSVVPTQWPTTVNVMIYPAGAVFRASADVITLDAVYDSVKLAKNQYTSLFTEEGIQVCNRCYDITLITIPLCPNGLSGATQLVSCEPPAPAPAAVTGSDSGESDRAVDSGKQPATAGSSKK